MTRKNGLPKRVYLKHSRYWFVAVDGSWRGLTRERDGLPAMFRALAALTGAEAAHDMMPAVVSRWLEAKTAAGDWSDGVQRDMERVAAVLSRRLAQFTPAQVTTPIAAQLLKAYLGKPRTYNLYRSVLRQVLSSAAIEGLREGHNPTDNIPQRKSRPRTRIVTPAEIDAMAASFMLAKRGGETHVRTLGLLLKTGQRISDVLAIVAQDLTDDGIEFDQGKTGERLLVEWDDELRALIDACYAGRDRIGPAIVQSTGKPYTYSGVRSAWVRAMAAAGISDLHIHDLRGEAGARITDLAGPYAAQLLLGHSSIKMTEAYIRSKTRRRATPAPLKKDAKSV